jgi:hypothetical protein
VSVPAFLRSVWAALRLPEVSIDLTGDGDCRETFVGFTRRHRRYWLIQDKRYGIALVPVPESFEAYLTGRPRQAVRTNRRLALDRGFTFRRIDPFEHLDAILAINRSADIRQGSPMPASYLTPEALRERFAAAQWVFGVFDAAGILQAYLDLQLCGELAMIVRLLGHVEALEEGVMYLLVSEGMRELCQMRQAGGTPHWLMYATWFRLQPGLRYFKERLGFAPYRVHWTWSP